MQVELWTTPLLSKFTPIGRASWRIFQVSSLSFGEYPTFQTYFFQLTEASAAGWVTTWRAAADAAAYPDFAEYDPDATGYQMYESFAPVKLGLRVMISSAKAGRIFLILAKFHFPVPIKIRSDTYKSLSSSLTGLEGSIAWSVEIQSSPHIVVEEPFPITLPRCSTSKSLPANIPLQPWDDVLSASTLRSLSFWQYLPSSTLASKQSGLVSILHEFLASRALLNHWMSFNPKPPALLGWVNFSHETQHIFFLPSFESHQNRVTTDWIFLQMLTGSSKHDIGKVGIAERTDWRSTSFPAVDSWCEDQESARCWILSTIEANRSFLRRLKCSGYPRYLPTPPSLSMPRIFFIRFLTPCDVLVEKVIDDLSELIFCPEAAS